MKYISLLLLAILALASCSSDKTELPDPDINFIQTAEVVFDGLADGQEKTIEFVSPDNWTAEIHQTGAWLKADVLSGKKGDAVITLTPRNDNFGVTSRQATLDIYIDGYQVYTIRIEQKSASTSDITIEGKIDQSVMTLQSDDKGVTFSDTIYVTSKKVWDIAAESGAEDILSFVRKGEPKNGEETRIAVIVNADCSKMEQANFEGKFYIKTSEGTAVPITIRANQTVELYANSRPVQDEEEVTSFELTDKIQHGVFRTTFYVDSNVRWTIASLPSWLESTTDTPSNIKKDGTIEKSRQPVTISIKPEALSIKGKTAKIDIIDSRGNVLKSVYLVFSGAGTNYIDYSFSVPANDINGNPWAFEAKKNTVEEEGPANRKRISLDFLMVTSIDYNSISDAPFHIILVDGTNGIAKKREMHWATLKMGSASEQVRTENGMYQKQLYIEANERGDADDTNGVTDASEIRNAFVYIVPRTVLFDDLWGSDGKMKDEYADNLTLISQKNDADADYKFSLVGYANGSKVGDINPDGQSMTFNVTPGSYAKCDYRIEKLNEGSTEWVKASESECKLDYDRDDKDILKNITLTFGENIGKYNALKKEWIGSNRDFRITFTAFINDDAGSKDIYTIYFHQELKK